MPGQRLAAPRSPPDSPLQSQMAPRHRFSAVTFPRPPAEPGVPEESPRRAPAPGAGPTPRGPGLPLRARRCPGWCRAAGQRTPGQSRPIHPAAGGGKAREGGGSLWHRAGAASGAGSPARHGAPSPPSRQRGEVPGALRDQLLPGGKSRGAAVLTRVSQSRPALSSPASGRSDRGWRPAALPAAPPWRVASSPFNVATSSVLPVSVAPPWEGSGARVAGRR
ncbi:uncharacterized protein LOC113943170 [Corapipo altera]|uniref:uncharacterized protein LOC113943170 n=1 Tax=Corapipo altera TaxID=415028 RepID=UPI000FD695EB|nr:uncharacterized protein LOC113943170 [Corapipo altera]